METASDFTLSANLDRVTCSNCGAQIDVENRVPLSSVVCPDCGTEGIHMEVGNYTILERLGSGAVGTVYKALDNSLQREVAIKVLQNMEGNEKEVDEFRREAASIAQTNHPNIAQVYAMHLHGEQPYIVMEYLPGETLQDLMKTRKPLDCSFVLSVAVDIAKSLSALSELSLVHGDVKPENMGFTDNYTAKLLDFGLATLEHHKEEGIFGTPYYIAPEKVRQQPADTRADMYSLGASIYHALAGSPPFSGKKGMKECVAARLKTDPPPLLTKRNDISPEVSKIVDRMLKRDPKLRYPSQAALIKDLQKHIIDPEKARKSPFRQAAKKKSRSTGPIQTAAASSSSRLSCSRTSSKKSPPQQSSPVRAIIPVILAGAIILTLALSINSANKRKKEASAKKINAEKQQAALKTIIDSVVTQAKPLTTMMSKKCDTIAGFEPEIIKLTENLLPEGKPTSVELIQKQNTLLSSRNKIKEIHKKACTIRDSGNASLAKLSSVKTKDEVKATATHLNKSLKKIRKLEIDAKVLLRDVREAAATFRLHTAN